MADSTGAITLYRCISHGLVEQVPADTVWCPHGLGGDERCGLEMDGPISVVPKADVNAFLSDTIARLRRADQSAAALGLALRAAKAGYEVEEVVDA